MTIQGRLALNFTIIVAAVLLLVMTAIYGLFAYYSKEDFYQHLKDRAHVAGQLYLEADEISRDSLNKVRAKYLDALPGELVRIYNKNDTAEFIKDNRRAWPGDVIDQVRDDKYIAFTEDSVQVVGVYYPDNQGNFVILVSAADRSTGRRMALLLSIMLPLYLFVTGAVYGAGRWFAARSLSPIKKVIRQVGAISASHLHLRVDGGKNKDEIAALAAQFNRLLEHLEHAFTMEKNLSAHVTHELRTPLTAIMGEIEVLLGRERTNTEYKETLQSVLAEAEQLADTINHVLELGQVVASNMLAMQVEPVHLDRLLLDLQEQWETRPGAYLLSVSLPAQTLYPVQANPKLLAIAFNNIIQNGYKFSGNQPVKCALGIKDGKLYVSVQDNGIGIDPRVQQQVFEPFFRAGQASNMPGTGLGLYIASQIFGLYHAAITISSAPGQTTLTIHFALPG